MPHQCTRRPIQMEQHHHVTSHINYNMIGLCCPQKVKAPTSTQATSIWIDLLLRNLYCGILETIKTNNPGNAPACWWHAASIGVSQQPQAAACTTMPDGGCTPSQAAPGSPSNACTTPPLDLLWTVAPATLTQTSLCGQMQQHQQPLRDVTELSTHNIA